jgi:cold shock protein
MKIGTVRWFNPQRGYGFIHPDDGSPNIRVHRSAVQNAGMSGLDNGQRISFEIQPDEDTGDMSAVSLKVLLPETTARADRPLATGNPLGAIPSFIRSAMSPVLLPWRT